jgi:transposase-like protein
VPFLSGRDLLCFYKSKRKKNKIQTQKLTRMEKLNIHLNKGDFSPETIKKITSKKTEKGISEALSTLKVFKEMYPDSESVFIKIYEVMRMKANDHCKCGAPISKYCDRIENTYKVRCKMCNTITSPLALTPLRRSRVPLNETLELALHLFHSKHGVSAAEIQRMFGWKYDTAWNQLHRVRIWCGLAIDALRFDNTTIEVDETFVRIPTGLGRKIRFSRGLGSERIKPVLTFIENGGEGKAKAFVIDYVEKETIQPLFHKHVSLTTSVFSDGKNVYNFLGADGYHHYECNHNKKEWSRDGAHVNTCESYNALLKGMIGTVHKGVSEEHLQKYLDQVSFVFSNRFNDAYSAINSLFEALPPLNSKSI